MKINFGCGANVLPGYTNIDATASRGGREPQLVHAMEFEGRELKARIPLADGCADELCAFHVIEHFYAWEAPAVIREWARLLRPSGRLVLELPNLTMAAHNLVAGKPDNMVMFPLYGDPSHTDPYMCHRWGYTSTTIQTLLADCGLRNVRVGAPLTHGAKVDRDMRVEAIR